MTIGIIDYGAGNLGSISGALDAIGASYILIDEPSSIKQVDKIILPGVGNFTHCKNLLDCQGWSEQILIAASAGKHILGICVGMQLLATKGLEGALNFSGTPGLGLIPGTVRSMSNMGVGLRLPHAGWNDISIVKQHPLLQGIEVGADFYFIHSYAYELDYPEDAFAISNYAVDFPALIARENIFGAQFHPEKSSKIGLHFLENFNNIQYVKG